MALETFKAYVVLVLVFSMTTSPTVRGCGQISFGQARTIRFNLTDLILPAALAFSQDMVASSIAPTMSKTEEEAKTFVQRIMERLLEDVLHQQGRSALLSDDVISLILRQIDVTVIHKPLKCDKVFDDFNMKGEMNMVNCLVVRDTVTQVCIPGANNQCEMPMFVKAAPDEHLSISGSITTTNVIMANWSNEMWHIILSRVLRSFKSKPLASSFYKASVIIS